MTARVHAMRRARAGRSGARYGRKPDQAAGPARRCPAHDDEAARAARVRQRPVGPTDELA
jgi:hypothetical protein